MPTWRDITAPPLFRRDPTSRATKRRLKSASRWLPDWIGAHVRAFAYSGGAARQTVSDNLKAGIAKASVGCWILARLRHRRFFSASRSQRGDPSPARRSK
jgi:transposase